MIALLGDDTSSYTEGFSQGRIPGIGVCVVVVVGGGVLCVQCFMFVKVGEEEGE